MLFRSKTWHLRPEIGPMWKLTILDSPDPPKPPQGPPDPPGGPGRPKMAQINIIQSSGDNLWQKIVFFGGSIFFSFFHSEWPITIIKCHHLCHQLDHHLDMSGLQLGRAGLQYDLSLLWRCRPAPWRQGPHHHYHHHRAYDDDHHHQHQQLIDDQVLNKIPAKIMAVL